MHMWSKLPFKPPQEVSCGNATLIQHSWLSSGVWFALEATSYEISFKHWQGAQPSEMVALWEAGRVPD